MYRKLNDVIRVLLGAQPVMYDLGSARPSYAWMRDPLVGKLKLALSGVAVLRLFK